MMLLITLVCGNSVNVLVYGLPFMKIAPRHFLCLIDDAGGDNLEDWESCLKADICDNELTTSEFMADTDDIEYIHNWVEQADLLCESSTRIGMIGASYFIGIIIATSIIPVGYLSDVFGRKSIFICNVVLTILSCIWLFVANNVEHLWIGMLISGMTVPGRMIVATAYADEFLDEGKRIWLVPLGNVINCVFVVATALYYQFLLRDIK